LNLIWNFGTTSSLLYNNFVKIESRRKNFSRNSSVLNEPACRSAP
jgi:hypothetical protein